MYSSKGTKYTEENLKAFKYYKKRLENEKTAQNKRIFLDWRICTMPNDINYKVWQKLRAELTTPLEEESIQILNKINQLFLFGKTPLQIPEYTEYFKTKLPLFKKYQKQILPAEFKPYIQYDMKELATVLLRSFLLRSLYKSNKWQKNKMKMEEIKILNKINLYYNLTNLAEFFAQKLSDDISFTIFAKNKILI